MSKIINKMRKSQRTGDSQSRVKAKKRTKIGRKAGVCVEANSTADPSSELGTDGQLSAAVDAMLDRSLMRGADGRFITGQVKTGEFSASFAADVAPLKVNTINRVKAQLAIAEGDGTETLLNTIDMYAEMNLLRRATFMQIAASGGPITNKGKLRALTSAYLSFFDRELKAAEKLGLERRSRRTHTTTRDWLLDNREHPINREDETADVDATLDAVTD